MKVLLVDHSGRGHAFADLFARTGGEIEVHYAPGCAAIREPRIVSVPSLALSDPGPSDPRPMVDYAREVGVDLVLVSNPVAVAEGFVDHFREAGLAVIGPDRAAARLESSKVEAKELFRRYGIPTPAHRSFDDPEAARRYVREVDGPVVVKADGMCGGNGAFVCDGVEDASAALTSLMVHRVFGGAGERVVVEERLYGREVSFFALLDGSSWLRLPMALDYPKSDDGNRGVDCAGMGALCPHPLESADLVERIERRILHPLMELIAAERLLYTGVVYLGLILVDDEPYLLEINARMGDPEAEVVFPRLENDFSDLCRAILDRSLHQRRLRSNGRCFCSVAATQGPTPGYPGWPYGPFERHLEVRGHERVDAARARVFLGQATVLSDGRLVGAGGRVVHVVGFGESIGEAVENAHSQIACVEFRGERHRSDIGRVLPWEPTGAGDLDAARPGTPC
jgi:phosphoribosylamine---glycine ligase